MIPNAFSGNSNVPPLPSAVGKPTQAAFSPKYDDGWQFRYHAVTWEEINTIFDLLKEAVPSFYVEEDEIIKIINEEAADYYHGQVHTACILPLFPYPLHLPALKHTL